MRIEDSLQPAAGSFNELEKKYDGQFQIVFEAIRQLIEVEEKAEAKDRLYQ
jgi:hypothetical protein